MTLNHPDIQKRTCKGVRCGLVGGVGSSLHCIM